MRCTSSQLDSLRIYVTGLGIVLIDEQKLLCLKLLLLITVLRMNLKKLGDIMSKLKRLSLLNIAIGVYLTTCLRNFASTNHQVTLLNCLSRLICLEKAALVACQACQHQQPFPVYRHDNMKKYYVLKRLQYLW